MAVTAEYPDHGCEHVTQNILDLLRKRRATPDFTPTFSSYYSCLQCPTAGEILDIDKHFKKSKHDFACGSKSLYCGQCKDLVYETSTIQTNAKKRKIGQISDEEDVYITANTSQRSCGREGVRGLFNLGETCYMNAVLQMMVHNQLLSSYFLGMGHPVHTCPISNQPEKRAAGPDSDDDEVCESKPEHKPCIACGFTELFAESRLADQPLPAHAVNLLYASWKAIPVCRPCALCRVHS